MKRFFLIGLSILFSLCIGTFFYYLSYDLVLYPIGVSLVSPHRVEAELSSPRQFTEIPQNDYFELAWSADGTSIRLFDSHWTSSTPDEPDTIFTVDVQSGKVIDSYREDTTDSSNATWNLRNATRIEGKDDTEWVKCLQGDVVVNLDSLDGDDYRLNLYQNDTLSATFPLSPFYSGDAGNRYISFLSFSPKCDYVALIFDGWLYYEAEGRDELWLLDVSRKTIDLAVVGRWPLVGIWDYPVQALRPDWSPDGKNMVFGDADFGLEMYNVDTATRSRFASLKYSGWDPKWSPSGKWVATEQWRFDANIVVLSADGKFFSSTPKCSIIHDFEWSPVNDQLVYLCDVTTTQTEGACGDGDTSTYSVWIWDMNLTEK